MNVIFNLNDQIRVKLNDRGRKIHRDYWEEIASKMPASSNFKIPETQEDSNGYSDWQAWIFMAIYGPHMFSSSSIAPFDMNIIITNTTPMTEIP